MWNTIATAIKTFLEKRFIPTIVAIVIMLVTLLITPDTFSIYVKLGRGLYCLLIFSLSFLIVTFLAFVVNQVKEKLKRRSINLYYKKENLKKLWNQIDGLNQKDYDLIIEFLKSENQPTKIITQHYDYDSFYNSDLLIKSKIGLEEIHLFGQAYMYQLKPETYELMIYSVHKHQKICNFKKLTPKDIEVKKK